MTTIKYLPALALFATFSSYSSSSLSEHPTWLKLGHYKNASAPQSYIESDSFFISKNGKNNPSSELKATIDAFNKDAQMQCKYPARYQWLLSQGLEFSEPKVECTELIEWRDKQPIHSVSLVFASGYMSNPASLYGHMLLKLNRSTPEHNKLLDYSLNYGALVPDNENGLVYITKGLFGGYEAGFSDQLFYRHQHNYGEIELRDIWEYKLNFSQEDVLFLTNHLWEIMGAKYSYYFADENCAFHIARVVELIIGEQLTNELSPWVIPATIFSRLNSAQYNNEKLVKQIEFTPSRSSVFHQYENNLSAKDSKLALAIYHSQNILFEPTFTNLDVVTKKRIIETLFEFVQLQQIKKYDVEHIEKLKKALIKARLVLPPGKETSFINYDKHAPHSAQKPSNISISSTVYKNEQSLNLGFRLSYFDSLASDIARVPYSNLEMLDVEVALFDSQLYLEKLHLLNLESFNPAYSQWPNEGGWAWQINVGYERNRSQCFSCSSTFAMAGVGKSWLLNANQSLVYGMINGYAGELQSTQQWLDTSIELGFLTTVTSNLKLRTSIEKFYHQQLSGIATNIELSVPINQDFDIRFGYKHATEFQWQLKLNFYWD